MSTFEGRTIFSIYFDNIAVYEQIHSQLYDTEFDDQENKLGRMIENSYLRRLMQILKLPTNDLARKSMLKTEEESVGE